MTDARPSHSSSQRGGHGGTGGTSTVARLAASPDCPPHSAKRVTTGTDEVGTAGLSPVVPLPCTGRGTVQTQWRRGVPPVPPRPPARNKKAATNSHHAVSHPVPLPSGQAGARAGRHARHTASGRSRAIRWRCRRETGRCSRGHRAVATRVRLVLTRSRRSTSTAGSRWAGRRPETRRQAKPFWAACEPALWSSEHRPLRRVPCWSMARTPAGIDQIRM